MKLNHPINSIRTWMNPITKSIICGIAWWMGRADKVDLFRKYLSLLRMTSSFKVHMYNKESLMWLGLWFRQYKVRVKTTTSGVDWTSKIWVLFYYLNLGGFGQIYPHSYFWFSLYKVQLITLQCCCENQMS